MVKNRLQFSNSAAKSLGLKILPITPLDGIFCEERFFLALCFQYFAEGIGGGGGGSGGLEPAEREQM